MSRGHSRFTLRHWDQFEVEAIVLLVAMLWGILGFCVGICAAGGVP